MSISWGNWDVRVYAAEAWVSLASRYAAENPLVIDQLEVILGDPVPAVRLQVAQNLQVIYAAAPERMWAMGERIVTQETSSEIVACYLDRALWRFSQLDPERCEAMLSIVKQRLDGSLGGDLGGSNRGRHSLMESLGDWTAHLFAGQGRPFARTWLEEWAADPQRYGELLSFFASSLRAALFDRYGPSPEPEARVRCDRAQEGLDLILVSATSISASAYAVHASDADEAEKEAARERYRAAERLIHHAMNQLYFGSGAHGRNREDGPGLPDASAKRRFLADYAGTLRLLADARDPATLHHLVELYEFVIPGDPESVFEAVYAILLGRGEEEGYHYESLGSTAVVRIVRRYIADHRAIFDDEGRRTRLVDVLRLFSQAGWPEALKLLYDLPDLLR